MNKQAEKSRKTREKILNAVKDLIDRGGFAAASSTRISRSAGVSWGVVQHHFGDKQGILLAVLEQCSDAYIDFMSAIPKPEGSRSRRIAHYIDRCWRFYCGKDYKIALEIALAMRFQESAAGRPEVFQSQQKQLVALWRSVFPDAEASDATLAHLVRHTYIVLTGLVIDEMLEGEPQNTRVQLQMLCATIEDRLFKKRRVAVDSGTFVNSEG